jgi:hypothetical protein
MTQSVALTQSVRSSWTERIGLITRRSEVQILSPPLRENAGQGRSARVGPSAALRKIKVAVRIPHTLAVLTSPGRSQHESLCPPPTRTGSTRARPYFHRALSPGRDDAYPARSDSSRWPVGPMVSDRQFREAPLEPNTLRTYCGNSLSRTRCFPGQSVHAAAPQASEQCSAWRVTATPPSSRSSTRRVPMRRITQTPICTHTFFEFRDEFEPRPRSYFQAHRCRCGRGPQGGKRCRRRRAPA